MSIAASAPEIQELGPDQIALIRVHMRELIASPTFAAGKRAQDFLQLIVGHALAGEVECLRERMIGAEMFHRPIDYDTANDSVVRVKATEVRRKLAQFYVESPMPTPVRIELPPGSYVPKFTFRADIPAEAVQEHSPLRDVPDPAPEPHPRVTGSDISGVEHHWPRSRLARRLGFGVFAALILASLTAMVYWSRLNAKLNAPTEIRSVVVLPFINASGDPKQDYLAESMTEELTADLGQVSALRVISRTSAAALKNSKRPLPEIARELSVDGAVEGSVAQDGNTVKVQIHLMDAKQDRPIWSHDYTRDVSDFLKLQGELARTIADHASVPISAQTQTHLARAVPASMEAEGSYMAGILKFNAGDCAGAASDFQEAVREDPGFAQAYAALAKCYGVMGEGGWIPYRTAFHDQRTAAARAVELDSSLSEAHAELAEAAMNLNWDWTTAGQEFRRALALNPNSAAVHESYSAYLDRTGDRTAAIAEAEVARKLDPLSMRSLSDLAYTYYFAREYDHALALLKEAKSEDSSLHPDIFVYADIYAAMREDEQAIREFLKLGDNPHALGHIGNIYARAGQANAARQIIGELEKRALKDGVGRYEIAIVYAGLGDKDQAFAWLERAFDARDKGLAFIKIDPCLDELRSDPRFADLVQRVGLAP